MDNLNAIRFEYKNWWNVARAENGTRYLPEKYQLGIITHYLSSRDFQYSTEAQVFGYPLDILAYKRETSIAIEMKSSNSKRGLEQAKRNSEFVDYSFLSVWDENITENLIQRVTGTNIGLISVSDGIQFISPPKNYDKSFYPSDSIRDIVTLNV